MDTNTKELVMSYDGHTIEHLGISMYSSIGAALAELIANAYDADAEKVTVTIDNKSKKIIVKDDGKGMSFDNINNHFLKIGRNRRNDESSITPKGRHVTGRKGLGKLALFGLAQEIKIKTTEKESNEKTMFILNWKEIIGKKSSSPGELYKPKVYKIEKENLNEQGTELELIKLKRKTYINIEDLAKKISWLFNFNQNESSKDKFEVEIIDQVKNKSELINRTKRYEVIKDMGVQKTWIIPDDHEININNKINGEIYACEKPIAPRYKGISLYANGRMVNAPSFFDISESGHFFSYISGWLEVDFIDDVEENLISTNRQSLNWDNDYIVNMGLRDNLQKLLNVLQKEWKKIRIKKDKQDIDALIDIEQWIKNIPLRYKSTINKIYEMSYAGDDEQKNNKKIIKILYDKIIPEYPQLLWRELHHDIINNKEVEYRYKTGDYYIAVNEAAKSYIKKVADLSGVQDKTNSSLMETVFGGKKSKQNKSTDKKQKDIPPLIQITDFNDDVEKDIERGQKYYSLGVVAGFRNVIAHGLLDVIKEKNLISEQDCLNTLSILSHLYSNLDKRKKPK